MRRTWSVHRWVLVVVEKKKVECFFEFVLVIVEERCLFLFSFWACCEGRGFFLVNPKMRVEREKSFASR